MRKTTLTALTVLAVAAGLAACGGSEPSAEPSTPPATTQEPATAGATTEPAQTETAATTQTETTVLTQTETAATTQPEAAGASVHVDVKDGQPVGGPKELTVSKGDRVTIEVSVDAADTIHVHGYDLEAEATPDQPAVIELTADLEGVFDVESHTTDALLVKLVVEP